MVARFITPISAVLLSASIVCASMQNTRTFEAFKRRMMPQVGSKITVVGVLKSAKLGWFVAFDGGGVYIYATGASRGEKMSDLNRFEGQTVKATGVLRHFSKPASVPSTEVAAVPPEHFFFDVDEVQVSSTSSPSLTREEASHFAKLALKCVTKEFPNQPNHASFERTYGWAWLLKLAEELRGWNDDDGKRWSRNLQPLADALVANYLAFLPKQNYPIRTGVHPNRAFGLEFALDYARAAGDRRLEGLIVERSRTYFGHDLNYPGAWEPGGEDFFSPALMEADLMRRVMKPAEFAAWFHRFLPGVAANQPRPLLTPAVVLDRTDPKLVHLDGLNLSRAWCMRNIATGLQRSDPARRVLARAAARHAEEGLNHVASGNYEGEHWLASFAVYLLSTPAP